MDVRIRCMAVHACIWECLILGFTSGRDDRDGCRLVELGRQVSILLSNASSNATQGDLTVIQAAQFAQLQFQAIPTAEANTWKVDSS